MSFWIGSMIGMHMKLLEKQRQQGVPSTIIWECDYYPRVLKVDMTEYVKSVREELPQKVQGRNENPFTKNLFKVVEIPKHLGQERKDT